MIFEYIRASNRNDTGTVELATFDDLIRYVEENGEIILDSFRIDDGKMVGKIVIYDDFME